MIPCFSSVSTFTIVEMFISILLTTEHSLTTIPEARQMCGLLMVLSMKKIALEIIKISATLSFSLGIYALFTIKLQKSDQETGLTVITLLDPF